METTPSSFEELPSVCKEHEHYNTNINNLDKDDTPTIVNDVGFSQDTISNRSTTTPIPSTLELPPLRRPQRHKQTLSYLQNFHCNVSHCSHWCNLVKEVIQILQINPIMLNQLLKRRFL